ncbi:MAG TPA: acyl-CoA dehydrogenase family protein [bacterium]
MSSNITSDIQSFRDLALRFAKKELEPRVIELDNYPFCDFNQNAIKAAMDAGLLQVMLPETHGGVGQRMDMLCEILLSLARSDASFASVVFVNSLAQSVLITCGSQPLVKTYFKSPLIAFPVYDLPTDLSRDLVAEKKNNGYSLKGKVEFLPLAPVADVVILPAQLKETEDIAFFLVDSKARGLSVSEPLLSLGLRSCPVADIQIDNVTVPAENLLCADAKSVYPALAEKFRSAAAAMAVGILTGSFETALTYAKERYQGGRMIVDYDQVRMMLSNMAVIMETGRTLVQSMAQNADNGQPWPLSDAGFILLTKQVSRATTDGVQILGGYGYMQDYGQEKRMRDAKQVESIFGAPPVKHLDLIEGIIRKGK